MSFKPLDMEDAETLARQEVVALWPELAGAEPSVARRQRHLPPAELLLKLGIDRTRPAPETDEYTFTYKGQIRTPEGYTLPCVARVVVDMLRGVVKVTGSR